MYLQFHIELNDSKPKVWRRFLVDDQMSFYEFHKTIQAVMGWQNMHLYMFRVDEHRIVELQENADSFISLSGLDSKKEYLYKYFTKEGQNCNYIYDFGDDWMHDIKLEKILSSVNVPFVPYCIKGELEAPMEDSRGDILFANEVLMNPENEEYIENVEWAREYLEPIEFNIEKVNSKLADLTYKKPILSLIKNNDKKKQME